MRPIDYEAELCQFCKKDSLDAYDHDFTYTCILNSRAVTMEPCFQRHEEQCELAQSSITGNKIGSITP